MEKEIKMILTILISLIILFIVSIIHITIQNSKNEQIKILEQSLNEQIQEKEVYMRMLEMKGEE